MMPKHAIKYLETGNHRCSWACYALQKFWLILLCSSCLAQILIEPSISNIECAALATLGSLISLVIVVRPFNIQSSPLATVAVVGLNISTLAGPVLFQTFSLKALNFNLESPENTFIYADIYNFAAVFALCIFTNSRALLQISKSISSAFSKVFGIYYLPSDMVTWVLGFLGLLVMVTSSASLFTNAIQFGDVQNKLTAGFLFLAYIPYLLPFRATLFGGEDTRKNYVPQLTFYTITLIVVGFARNSRNTFAVGLFTFLLCGILAIILGRITFNQIFTPKRAVLILIALLISPILSKFSSAMVIARSDRANLTAAELIKRTWDSTSDVSALEGFENSQAFQSVAGEYSENYLSNPFVARFVSIKYTNNMLQLPSVWNGQSSDELWAMTGRKILALLPTPVLKVIGSSVVKEDLQFSIGDYMYYLDNGTGLGVYRVGSPIAQGIALFGKFLVPASIVMFLFLFIILECFSLERDFSGVVVSPLIMLHSMEIYSLFSGDSMFDGINLFGREMPQSSIIYLLLSAVAGRLLLKR